MPRTRKKSEKQRRQQIAEANRNRRSIDQEYRGLDNERRRESLAEQRANEEFRQEDNIRRRLALAGQRADEQFLEQDNERRRVLFAEQREDEQFRELDNERRRGALAEQREDEQFRREDNVRRKASFSAQRANEEFRETNNEQRRALMANRRQDPAFNDQDRLRASALRRQQRQDETFRTPEKAADKTRKRDRRSNDTLRERDTHSNVACQKRRRLFHQSSLQQLLARFNKKIEEGPTWICSCCGGLFYPESVNKTSRQKLTEKGYTDEFINAVLYVNQEQHYFCSTCMNYVRRQKIPRLALSNGLNFPPISDTIKNLNRCEERLVSPRLPFLQIKLKGYEKQWALHGNVVNVENNLNTCVTSLPRQIPDTHVVQIKLMRRMCYTGHYIYDKIQPAKVVQAVKELLETPLYKKHGVILDENWEQNRSDSVIFSTSNDNEQEAPQAAAENNDDINDDAEEPQIGTNETLLYNEQDFSAYGIKIAPAEGNIPVPLSMDPDAELLSFPTIYAGQNREIKNVKLSTTDIYKSELRRYDRRCAKNEKILYMFKRSHNEKVVNYYNIALRQKPTGHEGAPLTAGQLKSNVDIQNLVTKNDGYKVFKNLRSSPAYWKEQSRRLVSQVRQLGASTLFITLSAAESKWAELQRILMKVLEKKDVSLEEVADLPYEKRAELIRGDPVTCMRHFDRKYRALLNDLFKQSEGVFAPHKVNDYYSRIEFQMRGSPHSHGLYWLENAPKFVEGNEESERECIEFIDKYITCRRDEEGEMEHLIGYQIHKHNPVTCRMRGNRKCRFGYPKPPMKTTMILRPLPKDFSNDERKYAEAAYKKIQERLSQIKRSDKEAIPHEVFLLSIGLTEDEYLNGIRSSLSRTTVFYQRRTNEVYINPYNKEILLAWKANMDIQFVLDSYACAKYCAGYVTKAEGGLSKLLLAIYDDIRRGNTSAKSLLQRFAKILIKGTEISAQEAVAFLLGLANTFCSRSVVFVNMAPRLKRIGLLRPSEELESLPDDSQDICQKGLIDHYVQRPVQLEDATLAEFACMYQYSSKKGKNINDDEEEVNSDNNEFDEAYYLSGPLPLLDGSGYVRRRTKRKILRYFHADKSNPKEYWREQLMLFVPWRNEERDLENIDVESVAQERMEEIKENSKPYFNNRDVDDRILGDFIAELESRSEALNEDEEEEEISNENELVEDEVYANSILTNTTSKTTGAERFLAPLLVENDYYHRMMRTLNDKQRRIVMHVLHCLKTKKTPFRIFLTGGAGVGKSHVITSIVQSYTRYCNKIKTQSPESIPVVVTAFSGKAAFNVDGMTMHNTFRIVPSQFRGKMPMLEESAANTLRVKLCGTDLFVFDEISMTSCTMFGQCDNRTNQVYKRGPDSKFGDRSVLASGHLRQLLPIPGGRNNFVFMAPGFPSLRNPLWEDFQLFELDEIMRQQGDREFCKALNNMSEGCMDEDDIALIKAREISTHSLDPPIDAVWLFPYNKQCKQHNDIVHERFRQQGFDQAMTIASDVVRGQGTVAQKQKLLNDAKAFTPQQSDGIPYSTRLQVSAVYFVTSNIDVADGLFNGATGLLRKIDYGVNRKNERVPTVAWMEFDDPKIGKSLRLKKAILYRQSGILPNWVPIERITRTLSASSRYQGLEISRTQIPLVAANGMTIAKSQGSSMKFVVVCTKMKLTRAHLYVACSRATTLKGLFIDGEFTAPQPPPENDPVTAEMETLRKNPVTMSLRFFKDVAAENKFYYHNIESFMHYRLDLEADPHIMSSSVIALVEPHIRSTDQVALSGYKLEARVDSRVTSGTSSNSEGYLLFVNNDSVHHAFEPIVKTTRHGDGHVLIARFFVSDLMILLCYKHPKYPSGSFYRKLESELEYIEGKTLVIGDFNEDFIANKEKITNFFGKYGMSNMLGDEATTDYGTAIDLCFSNANVQASIYETYYSYHKGICVSWDSNE